MKWILAIGALLISTSVIACEANSFGFYQPAVVSCKSRAELKQAIINGQLPQGDNAFVPETWTSTKTREQVVAETREAARLGLLRTYGDLAPNPPTPEQEQQITCAGLRATGGTAWCESVSPIATSRR